MTWKVTCVMEERFRLIEAYEREEAGLAELCRRFGVSRKTGYKWLTRYEEAGMEGLQDLSRAPHQHPNQVTREVEERVLELRREHPSWGPKKLYSRLNREEPEIHWPARSTLGEIIQRHGLSWARRPRRRATPSGQPLAHAGGPNQVWCADYKGCIWQRATLLSADDYGRLQPVLVALPSDAADRDGLGPASI